MPSQKKDCDRCAFGTKVSEHHYFCIFANCPYEKEDDPFFEKRRIKEHKEELAAKELEKEIIKKKRSRKKEEPEEEKVQDKMEDQTDE